MNKWHWTRATVIHRWLDRLAADRAPLRALEIGRIRNPIEVSGESTLHIAAHPGVDRLLSIDNNEATEAICRSLLPDSVLERITFCNGDGLEALRNLEGADTGPFDFAYLDGPNDAAFHLEALKLLVPICRPGSLVIVDDTDHPKVHKGDLAVPYANEHPDQFTVVEVVPRDKTCQGLTVIRMEEQKHA